MNMNIINNKTHGLVDSWNRGLMDSWTHGLMDLWTHKKNLSFIITALLRMVVWIGPAAKQNSTNRNKTNFNFSSDLKLVHGKCCVTNHNRIQRI